MAWTPRERLLAALHHEEPDRVPMDFGTSEMTSIIVDAYEELKKYLGVSHPTQDIPGVYKVAIPDETVMRRLDIDSRGMFLDKYVGSPVAKVIDEDRFIDIFNVRWEKAPGVAESQHLHIDGPFYRDKATVKAVEDFEWPDPNNPGMIHGLKERAQFIKGLDKEYARILYLPGGVIHRGYAMRGFEDFLKDLYKNTAFLVAMMDKLCTFFEGTAARAIETIGPENIDVVIFGEDLGTQDGCMFNPAVYAKYMKPLHRRMVDSIKSRSKAKVCFHCCGSAYHFVNHLIDVGVDALNPVQVTAKNMEPERLKADFGKRISFWGGINTQQILPYGTPDEVRAETRRIIDILGAGGGYILNPVHNVQVGVPPQNVVAMYEEGAKHRYKLAA